MGGFSAQVQPNQSSAPAGKGAGLSQTQLGQNPIQTPPEKQMMKMQELQMEQPSFPEANQIQNNGQYGTQLGGLGGLLGGRVTTPGQGGQPKIGMPNAYSNTVSPWDNSSNQPSQGSAKGKGA